MATADAGKVEWSEIVDKALTDQRMWREARLALADCLRWCRVRHGWIEDFEAVVDLALVEALAARPATPEDAARVVRREVRRHDRTGTAKRVAPVGSAPRAATSVGDTESEALSRVATGTVLRLLTPRAAGWCRVVLADENAWVVDRSAGQQVRRGYLGAPAQLIKELLAA